MIEFHLPGCKDSVKFVLRNWDWGPIVDEYSAVDSDF